MDDAVELPDVSGEALEACLRAISAGTGPAAANRVRELCSEVPDERLCDLVHCASFLDVTALATCAATRVARLLHRAEVSDFAPDTAALVVDCATASDLRAVPLGTLDALLERCPDETWHAACLRRWRPARALERAARPPESWRAEYARRDAQARVEAFECTHAHGRSARAASTDAAAPAEAVRHLRSLRVLRVDLAAAVLPRCSGSLTALDMSSIDDPAAAAPLIAGLASLERLCFKGSRLREMGLRAVVEALLGSRAPLRSLNVTDCALGVDSGKELGLLARSCATLTWLNASRNRLLDSGALILARALPGASRVRWLSLRECKITPEGLLAVCDTLCGGGQGIALRHLYLGGNCNAVDAALPVVCRAAAAGIELVEMSGMETSTTNPGMSYRRLDSCDIRRETVLECASSAQRGLSPRWLCLDDLPLSQDTARALAPAAPFFVSLSLSRCKLTDAASADIVRAVAQAGQSASLAELDLCGNVNVAEHTVGALAECLASDNCSLTALDIGETSVLDSARGIDLLAAIGANRSLVSLRAAGCRLLGRLETPLLDTLARSETLTEADISWVDLKLPKSFAGVQRPNPVMWRLDMSGCLQDIGTTHAQHSRVDNAVSFLEGFPCLSRVSLFTSTSSVSFGSYAYEAFLRWGAQRTLDLLYLRAPDAALVDTTVAVLSSSPGPLRLAVVGPMPFLQHLARKAEEIASVEGSGVEELALAGWFSSVDPKTRVSIQMKNASSIATTVTDQGEMPEGWPLCVSVCEPAVAMASLFQTDTERLTRRCGVLCPVQALGSVGKSAHSFVDWLTSAGQSVWVLLPTNPPSGEVYSPYSSRSAFAGDTSLVDVPLAREMLSSMGVEAAGSPTEVPSLWAAVVSGATHDLPAALSGLVRSFVLENYYWLPLFAEFEARRSLWGTDKWWEWPEPTESDASSLERGRSLAVFGQWLFFEQWDSLREHAARSGVALIADMPFYVGLESAEVWGRRELFQVKGGQPKEPPTLLRISGAPSDGPFPGQHWGMPLYDWHYIKERDNFNWWIKRFQHLLRTADVVRLDHFCGMSRYWTIPVGRSVDEGSWERAYGGALFDSLRFHLGMPLPIVPEDRGVIDSEMLKIREDNGLMSMAVFVSCLDCPSDLPARYTPRTFAMTGTHDMPTVCEWVAGLNKEQREKLRVLFGTGQRDPTVWEAVAMVMRSQASVVVVQLQDVLELGFCGRYNVPGTAAEGTKAACTCSKSVWLDFDPSTNYFTWNHFCILVDRSSKAKAYLNGILMTVKAITRLNGFVDGPLGISDVSTLATLDGSTTCSMTMGFAWGSNTCTNPTTYTSATVDEFGLWKRVLTTAEVTSLANPRTELACSLNASEYDSAPELIADNETGFTSLNQLVFKVKLPMGGIRNYTLFQIGRTCSLGVASTKITGCNSTVMLAPFAWSYAATQACGIARTVSGTVQTWTGVLTGVVDMLFTVRLETAVSVATSNMSIFTIPGANPIITGMSLAVLPSGVSGFILEMTVGVKKPFTTTWPQGISFPSSQGTISFSSVVDLASSSSYTWRKYVFAVAPTQGLSKFTDVPLAINFTLGCSGGSALCSGIGNQTAVQVSFRISTGTWLPTIAGSASLGTTINADDLDFILREQEATLAKAKEIRAALEAFNDLSQSEYDASIEALDRSIRLQREMKKDLDQSFRKIRSLTAYIKQHAPPGVFQATSTQLSEIAGDD
eukprot:m51a1_g14705 hypothetical protein (1707) ;mRNA; f:137512-147049